MFSKRILELRLAPKTIIKVYILGFFHLVYILHKNNDELNMYKRHDVELDDRVVKINDTHVEINEINLIVNEKNDTLKLDARVDKINNTSVEINKINLIVYGENDTLPSCGEGHFRVGKEVRISRKEGRFTQEALMKSFGKLNYDVEPLSPFTSGEPPICTLEMSNSYPILVILLSLVRFSKEKTIILKNEERI